MRQTLAALVAAMVSVVTVCHSGGQPMRAFYLEITAKLIIRSDTEPDDLPADVYSHLAEFIPSDEDIIGLEVHAVPLPSDLGTAPH